MELAGLEKLVAAIGAAIAAALTPVGVIYTASIGRKSKLSEATISSLTAEVEGLKKQLESTESELDKERSESLRWRQLSLIWFGHAHDMRRLALDARQTAETLAHQGKKNLPSWVGSTQLPLIEQVLTTTPN